MCEYQPLPGLNEASLPAPSHFNEDLITVQVGQKRFTAHRSILGKSSPVFDAMFTHEGLLETSQRRVTIKDVDALVFEELLHFMYKGKLDKQTLDSLSIELWIAADKYQIEPLTALCEEHVCPVFTVKSVLSTLLLAHQCGIERLKAQSMSFLGNNLSPVRRQKSAWRDFLASAPTDVLAQVYHHCAVKLKDDQRMAERDKETIERLQAAQQAAQPVGRPKVVQLLGWLVLGGVSVAGGIFTVFTILGCLSGGVSLEASYGALILFFALLYGGAIAWCIFCT